MPFDPDMALDDISREQQTSHSEAFADHALSPRNVGSIPNSDGFGSVVSDCGDTMGIWLKVNGGVIRGITFWTDGCYSAIATGSVVTELAQGRSVPEALGISRQTVLDALGGMPEDSAHCAVLAANTLHAAIRDYLACRTSPWKQDYRK